MTDEEKDKARMVLGYFGAEGGTEPGGFTGLILRAYQKADPGNKARLRLGFPVEAQMMDACMDTMTGLAELQARVQA